MYNDELYHHGILNMRWGARNGPPYPLKKSVSRQIKKGRNPKFRKNRGQQISSLNQETPEEMTRTIQEQLSTAKHPDKKYMNSRKFGSTDLERLTRRFNDERSFNEALKSKLESENRLDEAMLKNLSRKQRKELVKKMAELELNASYNRAVQQSIQSQIDLITSQKKLRELTAKPPTKWAKAKKATGEVISDIGKKSVKDVGGQVATYFLGTAINNALGQNIVNTKGNKNNKKNDKKNNRNDDED